MALRVGRIPFLVCAPFFHDFLGRESRLADVEFVDGPPSAHCAGLKDGSIHLSPASSITFAQKPGAFVLAPDICTSCSFEVRSVKLYAKRPIEDLDGRTVRLTGQSMTSVNLLKILMRERFDVEPVYGVGAYEPSDDACLLIGDQALEENSKKMNVTALRSTMTSVPFGRIGRACRLSLERGLFQSRPCSRNCGILSKCTCRRRVKVSKASVRIRRGP